jgi:hypothetical protein
MEWLFELLAAIVIVPLVLTLAFEQMRLARQQDVLDAGLAAVRGGAKRAGAIPLAHSEGCLLDPGNHCLHRHHPVRNSSVPAACIPRLSPQPWPARGAWRSPQPWPARGAWRFPQPCPTGPGGSLEETQIPRCGILSPAEGLQHQSTAVVSCLPSPNTT